MLRDGDSIELKYFLVAYLDLLGQRDELRQLTDLPGDLQPDERTVSALKATLGAVHGFRSSFADFFKVDSDVQRVAHLIPEDRREAVGQLMRSEIIQYGFSDSMVVAVSLKGAADDPAPINGVWSTLVASSSTAIASLASHHPLRGGIDVGLGVQISENEVYGPALERAYHLEQKAADWPRILIGAELQNYLEVVSRTSGKTPAGRYVASQAQATKQLVSIDSDGRAALDFLGPQFRSMAGEETLKVAGYAYEFVRTEHKRFTDAGNSRLAERYGRLLAYFKLRGPMWGLTG